MNFNKSTKLDPLQPNYTMKIPVVNNIDNFRLDKIIETYKGEISKIASLIVPRKKDPPKKLENLPKSPEILARIKLKRENDKKLLKINDAIITEILHKQDLNNKNQIITRLVKGDSKFMTGIPQLKSTTGKLLNSPSATKSKNINKLSSLDLNKFDDSFENKFSENITNTKLKTTTKDKDFIFNTINSRQNNSIENFLSSNKNKSKIIKEDNSFISSSRSSSIYFSPIKKKIKKNFFKETNLFNENSFKSKSKKNKKKKFVQEKIIITNIPIENKNDKETLIKNTSINYMNYNTTDTLEKLRNKSDFFNSTEKNINTKNKLKFSEKKFNKLNYMSTMREFINVLSTESEYYNQTFSTIEKGIKNYDYIKSVHVNIPEEKLKDKKIMYTKNKDFVRKFFVYGDNAGGFISEDKKNDNIIQISDNLTKLTPEITFKFRDMIMKRFNSEKIELDYTDFLKRDDYKDRQCAENARKVNSIIDETENMRNKVEIGLNRIMSKLRK